MEFECMQCLECCKKYWIALLPEKAEEIASALGLGFDEFIENHTVLYIQLFQASYKKDALIVPSALIPKNIFDSLKKFLPVIPDFFLVLPNVALKRNGACDMLDSLKKICKVYDFRPAQCRLFPFVSIKNSGNLSQDYPFCLGLKGFEKGMNETQRQLQELHFFEFEKYFNSVKKNGFVNVWKTVPKKGIVLFEDKKLCEISLDEFSRFFSFQ